MRRVAITHVAQSSGVESKESLMDFTYAVNKEILDKAGLKREEVGCIIAGAADIFHSGLSCANAFDWDGIGAFLK
jgi:3-oxoacyl-[acyl-carrier-protein] synthase III